MAHRCSPVSRSNSAARLTCGTKVMCSEQITGSGERGGGGCLESLKCSTGACQQDEQKLEKTGQPGSDSHAGTTQHIYVLLKPTFS